MAIIFSAFFERDACTVARELLGKVIRRKYNNQWLAAQIIETEAYYIDDRGSHASLGYTEKRKALFMPAGTIYMYYARGKDSLNVSCAGEGNAVLIKSAYPYFDALSSKATLKTMQQLNPDASGNYRSIEKLCRGQTLLCQSLQLKVKDWDQQQFDKRCFYFDAVNYQPETIIQTTRLGIPRGRDEHLQFRYIDYDFAASCTSNPLSKRGWKNGREYLLINNHDK